MLFASIIYLLIFSLCLADFDETLLFCGTKPPKLVNGLIKRDRVSYYNGQGYLGNMEYMCSPGFDLIGNKIVTCGNGIWTTMPQCIPKKRCSPIEIYPFHTIMESNNITFFQNDPQQILVGSIITLRCTDNYEFDPTSSGSLVIQCQNDGSWTPMPSCQYVQATCDYSKLYLPSRSRITRMNFQFSESNRQLHLAGSNLEYSCEDGYRLNDGKTSLIVECLPSGSWSILPICEFVYQTERNVRCSYPIYIKNGFITLYNVTIWEDQTYTGRITYECNYGFETLDGTDQIQSECLNGTWTYVGDCQEIPTCPKEDLMEIESLVENSYVHNVSLQYIRDPLAFVYNSYVLRVCLPNFEHDPSSSPLKIQCQRGENTWTGIPICRAIKTPTVIISTEGEEIQIESDDFVFPIISNDTLSQTTTTGPRISTENEEIHMKSDNLVSIITSSPAPFQTTKTMISTENEEIQMESDGFLSQTATSIISTENKEADMESENFVSSIASSPSTSQTTTTTPMISTENEEIQMESEDFVSPNASIPTPSPTTTPMISTENEEIQMNIDDLLSSITSSPPSFQTTTEMEDSTAVFHTTPTVVCYSNEIPIIPNSILNESVLNITYDVGTKLIFRCQSGYESLYNETSFIICSMNGTWTSETIDLNMCQLKSEPTEEILFDTSTISSNIAEENNTSEYLDEDLSMLNISNETSISSTRSISAGNRQIRQITSYCQQFPQIDHAQLLIDDTIKHNSSNQISYSGSVLFLCPFGFLSDNSDNEPFRLTCQDGVFHPKVTCIEKARCSLPPPIDLSRSSIINSLINVFDTSTDQAIPGSFISLNCLNKTNDEKFVFNMTCLDNGQWLLPPSLCITPFKRRCQSGITIPNARTQIYAKLTTDGYYDDGSKATYRCLENFVHDGQSGPLHIQCRNGRWGPRPRCLPSGCVEPLPDTIENGWKSAESFVVQGDSKYYLLTRYSCHENALMVDSSTRVIDIECRNGQWQYETLPVCQLQE